MTTAWVTIENGVPFNHYLAGLQAVASTWIHSGWDDGDPFLYSYVGHPIHRVLTGYIEVQNDPPGETLEFSNTRYWWSRGFPPGSDPLRQRTADCHPPSSLIKSMHLRPALVSARKKRRGS